MVRTLLVLVMIHSVWVHMQCSTEAFQLLETTRRHTSFLSSSINGGYEPSTLINPTAADDDTNNNNMKKQQKIMSIALPFAPFPEPLLEFTDDNAMAGNNGFDPLNICRNSDDVMYYREAEIRHARLAMLAAVGWPISEWYDSTIANYFNLPTITGINDRVPSILNGGLERTSPVFWGCCFGMTIAIEQYAIYRSRHTSTDKNYFPGNLGFDPLNLYPNNNKESQLNMQLAEIKHGRIAMIAITLYAIQEYITQIGVIDPLMNPEQLLTMSS